MAVNLPQLEKSFENFKGSIKERLSSPLITSFFVSWTIINYKVVLIVLADESLSYKLKLISWYFSNHSVSSTLLLPLIAVFVYVFVYPYVLRPVNRFLLNRKLDIQRDTYSAEGRQLVDEARLKEILVRFHDQKKDLLDEIATLRQENSELTAKLDSLQNDVSSPVGQEEQISIQEPQSPLDGLSKDELEVITILGKREDTGLDFSTESSIASDTSMGKLRTSYAVQQLVDKLYIVRMRNRLENEHKYKLGPKGMEAFIRLTSVLQP
jgi:hypothetical protein